MAKTKSVPKKRKGVLAVQAKLSPELAATLPAVGSAANAQKLSSEKRRLLLDAISQGQSIESAAALIGVTRAAVFLARNNDPEFGAAFDKAKDLSTDFLEDHLFKHATQDKVPGNFVACLAILKARRPAVWRENVSVQHTVTPLSRDLLEEARTRANSRDPITIDQESSG